MKIKYSHFAKGQTVYLTNSYEKFYENEPVQVVDNEKKPHNGAKYCITVRNTIGTVGLVPTKYLSE